MILQRDKDLEVRDKNRKNLFFLFVLLTFIGILLLNLLYPYFADDFGNAQLMNELKDKGGVLFGLQKIPSYLHDYYFGWGGRVVGQGITYLLLLIGYPLNKIINALAYSLFVYLIYLLTKPKSTHYRLSSFLYINILLFALQAVLGDTILWVTGSANYLWTTLILLFFLLPYKNFHEGFKNKHKATRLAKIIYLFAGGIIAGWTNENVVPAVVVLIIAGLIYYKRKGIKLPGWFYSGFSGFIIGFLLLVLAPGNAVRISKTEIGIHHFSFVQKYGIQFFKMLIRFETYFIPAVLLFIVLFLYVRFRDKKFTLKSLFSFAFFITGLLSVLAMALSPNYPPRACFGSITLLIISIISLFNTIHISGSKIRFRIQKIILICSVVFCLLYYFIGLADVWNTNKILKQRVQTLNHQKIKGVYDFEFDNKIRQYTKFNTVIELSQNPNYWANKSYCQYYQIHSIKIKPYDP